jgi:hypothetical protein
VRQRWLPPARIGGDAARDPGGLRLHEEGAVRRARAPVDEGGTRSNTRSISCRAITAGDRGDPGRTRQNQPTNRPPPRGPRPRPRPRPVSSSSAAASRLVVAPTPGAHVSLVKPPGSDAVVVKDGMRAVIRPTLTADFVPCPSRPQLPHPSIHAYIPLSPSAQPRHSILPAICIYYCYTKCFSHGVRRQLSPYQEKKKKQQQRRTSVRR